VISDVMQQLTRAEMVWIAKVFPLSRASLSIYSAEKSILIDLLIRETQQG